MKMLRMLLRLALLLLFFTSISLLSSKPWKTVFSLSFLSQLSPQPTVIRLQLGVNSQPSQLLGQGEGSEGQRPGQHLA